LKGDGIYPQITPISQIADRWTLFETKKSGRLNLWNLRNLRMPLALSRIEGMAATKPRSRTNCPATTSPDELFGKAAL